MRFQTSPKFSPPALTKTLFRHDLIREIDLQTAHSAIWIGGGHGTGKTTLAAQWTNSKQNYLWLEVDEADCDLATLLSNFKQALSRITPNGYHVEQLSCDLPHAESPQTRLFFRNWYSHVSDATVIVIDSLQNLSAIPLLRPAPQTTNIS